MLTYENTYLNISSKENQVEILKKDNKIKKYHHLAHLQEDFRPRLFPFLFPPN